MGKSGRMTKSDASRIQSNATKNRPEPRFCEKSTIGCRPKRIEMKHWSV